MSNTKPVYRDTRGRPIARELKTPVWIPRWVLAAKYLCYIVLGITVLIASNPTLQQTTPRPEGSTVWAVGLLVGGLVALVGSLHKRWDTKVELPGVTIVIAFMVFYFGSSVLLMFEQPNHAWTRASLSVVLFTTTMLPSIRCYYLVRAVGTPRG